MEGGIRRTRMKAIANAGNQASDEAFYLYMFLVLVG